MSIVDEVTSKSTSPQIRTALTWLKGMETWDIEASGRMMSDESFEQIVLPASLGRASRNKKEWIDHFTHLVKPMLKNFKSEVLETLEAPGKLFLHAKATAMSTTGAPYNNEFMLVFTFDGPAEDPKICCLKEFIDTATMMSFMPGEMKRQAEKKAAGAV